MIPFPDKRYSILYVDPPWSYQGCHLGTGSPVVVPYSVMTVDELKALPVPEICETDCLLFMWAVSPLLPEAIEVGKAWGFEYKTVAFVWNKKATTIGYYTLSQVEICLVFKRKGGKIPHPRGRRNVRQFLSCKRGEHSRKPLEIKQRIGEMFPSQSKIELFARPDWIDRQMSVDWDFWGDEVEKREEVITDGRARNDGRSDQKD